MKRLASLGCSRDDLVTSYIRLIRSVCEFAVPYWGPMISKEETRRLERIQRTAVHVIMGENFTNYSEAIKECNLERLDKRRNDLIERFAVNTADNPKFKHWFKENSPSKKNNRNRMSKLKPVTTRTEKYKKSAIPRMTEILNNREKECGGSNNQDDQQCSLCKSIFSNKHNLSLHLTFRYGNDDSYFPRWSKKIL